MALLILSVIIDGMTARSEKSLRHYIMNHVSFNAHYTSTSVARTNELLSLQAIKCLQQSVMYQMKKVNETLFHFYNIQVRVDKPLNYIR